MDLKKHSLNICDYKEVARLHHDCLNESFLGTLGIPFLTLLYEAIDKDNESVLFVKRENNVIVGFVSGTNRIGQIYRQLILNPFRLIFSLKSCLLSPSKIYRIIEVLLATNQDDNSIYLPKHELLSIAVSPDYQGSGHAENLFKNLCTYFKSKGVRSFRIVVGSNLSKAHNFYNKMESVPVKEIQVHKGSNSIVYVKKIDQ